MDEILINEKEEEILCKGMRRFDFPAIAVGEHMIYFNAACADIFHSDRVKASKTNDYLILRDSGMDSRGYTIKIIRRANAGFCISARTIIQTSGLRPGSAYRLYKIKGGGYAVKRYEPEQV